MKFLVPSGGFTDKEFGILTYPQMRGVPVGIKEGMSWAADLGCISGPSYVKRFDSSKVFPWLETMKPYLETCLFITAPDCVGDAGDTFRNFGRYDFGDFPVAYVAQDGQEDIPFPADDLWQALFIGGSTEWKTGYNARVCIEVAKKRNKHIHIGRVNYKKRYITFGRIDGSDKFTCDGTRLRFERTKTLSDWKDYMKYSIEFCKEEFENKYNKGVENE
jgi:hypothetical protein